MPQPANTCMHVCHSQPIYATYIYATASKYIYATARLLAWGRATRLRQNECCHLACEDPVPCDASANASLVPTHPAPQELVNLAYHLVPAPTTSRIGRSNDSGILMNLHCPTWMQPGELKTGPCAYHARMSGVGVASIYIKEQYHNTILTYVACKQLTLTTYHHYLPIQMKGGRVGNLQTEAMPSWGAAWQLAPSSKYRTRACHPRSRLVHIGPGTAPPPLSLTNFKATPWKYYLTLRGGSQCGLSSPPTPRIEEGGRLVVAHGPLPR